MEKVIYLSESTLGVWLNWLLWMWQT